MEGIGLPTMKPCCQLPVVEDTGTQFSVMLVRGSPLAPPILSNVTVAPAADPIVTRTMLIPISHLCIKSLSELRVVGYALQLASFRLIEQTLVSMINCPSRVRKNDLGE